MTEGVALGSYLAAGFLVLGMLATALIPNTRKAHSGDHPDPTASVAGEH